MGASGPSGDFEIRDDRRNDLGRGIMPVNPDLIGNTVDAGSSAAQLPQKNILERKEVLIGMYLCVKLMFLSHPNLSCVYLLFSAGHLLDQHITSPCCLLYSFPAYWELLR